jgi:hypothetical protein
MTTTGSLANRKVYERLRSMRVGEEFLLRSSEWKTPTEPTHTIRYSPHYRGRFSVTRLEDGTGWLIVRLK